MAIFSRRPKGVRDESAAETPAAAEPAAESETLAAGAGAPATPDQAAATEAAGSSAAEDGESTASVDISVSSFRGLGARVDAAHRSPVPAAAPPTETVPGLRDNVLVREALAGLGDTPSPLELLNVARQLMQGHLFLRVKGDARALLAAGEQLPLAMVSAGERSFALAYSSGAALQASVRADGDVDTSAMGQSVLVVIRHVLAGTYDGLIVDHASAPARAVFPRALLEKLVERFDESLTVKTLLAEERTPATIAAVAEALTRVPIWVAVGRAEGDDRLGIAEGRGPDGRRYLEVYSHPLEVAAMGRTDQPAPLTGAQLGGALRSDEGLAGVVVDPRGPWIQLTRDDLAALIALTG